MIKNHTYSFLGIKVCPHFTGTAAVSSALSKHCSAYHEGVGSTISAAVRGMKFRMHITCFVILL